MLEVLELGIAHQGFLCCSVIPNADRRRAVGKGVPANFFAFYEIDGDESKHNLSLDDYGCENDVIESGKWVLLK